MSKSISLLLLTAALLMYHSGDIGVDIEMLNIGSLNHRPHSQLLNFGVRLEWDLFKILIKTGTIY